ncbi:PREDICTED: beta-glucuronosyltransferase GlcAT14B-like [Tarenaya hassleriana]|uniref:beta-glucuronosyltransferase GlcAT14B-like n=1 Tax=Tarenaya hassleriana TaxID=28532 RepID=UPI00053C304D|nr:PREDICTED: beta-glucuronosyltransferase GlcAT14B-like [Tarenaya hassleriana]XP_010533168.1 PREDICTED: beta-glucuronosyltransferase GlcAT14B-like [Tarenaya hassleriana]
MSNHSFRFPKPPLMDVSKLQHQNKRKVWFLSLILFFIASTLLIITSTFSTSSLLRAYAFSRRRISPRAAAKPRPKFVESKLRVTETSKEPIPRIAYLISGSRGDCESLKRALRALYHPRNQYVVHLDLEATAEERMELARFTAEEPSFAAVGNVRTIVRANLVTYRGPTMVSNTLHAAAVLLRHGGAWDWFINLSASDYPLVTQDDLLHVFSTVPRDFNFIEHTSDIGWKEWHRAKPVIIDPGLYSLEKSDVFWVTEKRSMPSAYRLFTGSAWMMLSRQFIEYSLFGWDNLPRITLMYYSNFLSSPEGYFHTVICNADEFKNTTVNHDLHFISWDNPPKQHPHFLTTDHFDRMVGSNAPFARKFGNNEPVLDRIDSELLGKSSPDVFVPGGWFRGEGEMIVSGNGTELRPGPGAERLKKLITGLLSAQDFRRTQCA